MSTENSLRPENTHCPATESILTRRFSRPGWKPHSLDLAVPPCFVACDGNLAHRLWAQAMRSVSCQPCLESEKCERVLALETCGNSRQFGEESVPRMTPWTSENPKSPQLESL